MINAPRSEFRPWTSDIFPEGDETPPKWDMNTPHILACAHAAFSDAFNSPGEAQSALDTLMDEAGVPRVTIN